MGISNRSARRTSLGCFEPWVSGIGVESIGHLSPILMETRNYINQIITSKIIELATASFARALHICVYIYNIRNKDIHRNSA